MAWLMAWMTEMIKWKLICEFLNYHSQQLGMSLPSSYLCWHVLFQIDYLNIFFTAVVTLHLYMFCLFSQSLALCSVSQQAAYLNCSLPPAKQHFLAVADDLGVLRIFEIPKALYLPSRHEVRARLVCLFKKIYNNKSEKPFSWHVLISAFNCLPNPNHNHAKIFISIWCFLQFALLQTQNLCILLSFLTGPYEQ